MMEESRRLTTSSINANVKIFGKMIFGVKVREDREGQVLQSYIPASLRESRQAVLLSSVAAMGPREAPIESAVASHADG